MSLKSWRFPAFLHRRLTSPSLGLVRAHQRLERLQAGPRPVVSRVFPLAGRRRREVVGRACLAVVVAPSSFRACRRSEEYVVQVRKHKVSCSDFTPHSHVVTQKPHDSCRHAKAKSTMMVERRRPSFLTPSHPRATPSIITILVYLIIVGVVAV